MTKIKALALKKDILVKSGIFSIFLAISLIAPLFHIQSITGPIINAVIFLAVIMLPIEWALMLCLIPSLVALSVGTLPQVLAVMVPFIMTSNAILALTFYFLKEKNKITAVVAAASLKFAFLFSTSFIVLRMIAEGPIAQKAAQMMSWPQLVTALGGGLIVLLLLYLKK